MKREHLGSITVTGMFALVLQFRTKEEQSQQNQQQSQQNQQQSPQNQQEKQQQKKPRLEELVAHIGLTSGGLAKRIELYGDYVVRQIGLSKESPVSKALAEVAMGYLKGDKSPNDHSLDAILAFLSKACNRDMSDQQMLVLNRELVKELDACMLSYFAFHWHHSAHLLDQVLSGERKLRSIVMAATRKHRFQRAMQALKAKRAFATLVETLKAMKQQEQAEQQAEERRSSGGGRPVRRPVLLLVGGGMGAGKSTVVKQLLHDVAAPIVQHDAVVVEADAFKETDVLYRSLLSSGGSGDMTMASQMVHDDSTRAASSLLVSALNDGRDVVLDGTMSWEPFVTQTIAMARDVHRRRYRLGPGYLLGENGVLVERYWEPVEDLPSPSSSTSSDCPSSRSAYRIELVGVICDALLAVMRGIRRAIITNRFVPIPAQLGSHKMFAASLDRYCEIVDGARIYSTSRMGGPPELIGWKEPSNGELRVDPEAFKLIKELAELNPDAGSVLELYHDRPSNVWNEVVFSPDRAPRQEFVRNMLSGDGEYSSGSGCSSPESSSSGGESSSSSSTDLDSYNSNSSSSSSLSLSLSSDSISSSSGSHLSLSSLEDSN